MKSWLESLLIALSMYSAIPVKCLNWTEKNLRNAMVFFPLVGLLCGVGLWLVWLVCGLLHVSSVLFGVLAVASGVLITGAFIWTASVIRQMLSIPAVRRRKNCGF